MALRKDAVCFLLDWRRGQALRTLEEVAEPVRRLNVVWVVIAPCRSHAFGLNVVGDNVVAVGKRQVTDSAVSMLRRDFLGEHFPQFRG